MSVIDQVTSHFRNKLAGNLGSIDVPEWGEKGKSLKIYFKGATSPKVQERLAKLVNESKPIEAAVEALIIRSLDEDGNKMFKSVAHKTMLMTECDVDVLIRVIGEINNTSSIDSEDVLGN